MKKVVLSRSPSADIWKNALDKHVTDEFKEFIENFETDLFFKKQKKIEDKLFAETRLRMGAYGQRYDNAKRSNGKESVPIPFPGDLTKGPDTAWHAPGMQRIKLPYGGLTPEQMYLFADLSEEYSDGISHITTRQDIQLHFVHIEDTPSMFRRLAAANITTREACGNSVRNITACPYVGVCRDESFNTHPHADAIFKYLLGHPDVQDFGRKFKISVSGCKEHSCGLAAMHDLGIIATTRKINGQNQRGFEVWVGGGLGAIPHQAKLLSDFTAEVDLLSLIQAVCRVYARHGEKKIRNRSRIKFLVADWGIEKFTKEVMKEKEILPPDPRWTAFLDNIQTSGEEPLVPKKDTGEFPESREKYFSMWLKNNVRPQKQGGYNVVTVTCPLGDVTANQMRALADITKTYTRGTARTTIDQNLVIRWIANKDLKVVYDNLLAIKLAEPFNGSIVDVTACPGTDTCKLGISASRGLAAEIRNRLAVKALEMDESVRDLKIKVSGCFNSCGQQHLSDIGFFGTNRKIGGYVVPHFQMLLGGESQNNGESYGINTMPVPSKAVPDVIEYLTKMYLQEKNDEEIFRDYVERVGKVYLKKNLEHLTKIPAYDQDKSYYVDWADVREFSIADKGIGECAGEIVGLADFGLQTAEREVFEAQVKLDEKDYKTSANMSYQSMLRASQALIKHFNPDISNDPEEVMGEFKQRIFNSGTFNDISQGDKFAKYYFKHHEEKDKIVDAEQAEIRLREAQLFIEAAHSCNLKLSKQTIATSEEELEKTLNR